MAFLGAVGVGCHRGRAGRGRPLGQGYPGSSGRVFSKLVTRAPGNAEQTAASVAASRALISLRSERPVYSGTSQIWPQSSVARQTSTFSALNDAMSSSLRLRTTGTSRGSGSGRDRSGEVGSGSREDLAAGRGRTGAPKRSRSVRSGRGWVDELGGAGVGAGSL